MARRARVSLGGLAAGGSGRLRSASLRAACRSLTRLPDDRVVGRGELLLYNDAFLPARHQHPALGKPGEVPARCGTWPMLHSVMSSGQAIYNEDLLLWMNRHDYWEETYWTYSYSPLHDDDGVVRGVFTAVATPPNGSSAHGGSPPCRTWAPRQAAPAAWPKPASSS